MGGLLVNVGTEEEEEPPPRTKVSHVAMLIFMFYCLIIIIVIDRLLWYSKHGNTLNGFLIVVLIGIMSCEIVTLYMLHIVHW